MERIRALINKLQLQLEEKAEASEMMVTVQILQAELEQASAFVPRQMGTAKVAVVLPSNSKASYKSGVTVSEPATISVRHPEFARFPEVEKKPEVARQYEYSRQPESYNQQVVVKEEVSQQPQPVAQAELVKQPEPVKQPEAIKQPEPVKQQPVSQTESYYNAVNFAGTAKVNETDLAPDIPKKQEATGWLFDPVQEIPTLAHQKEFKEMNDVFQQYGSSSLNDKLKTDKTELGAVLKEGPVKDLKKAIGINDRFVFLSELFRGDEAMYERSLKTINNFRIFPEAEYWIERELKVKLGWDESKETVKQFCQLVKRRFS